MALATALDLDLDTPALKDLLERKKAAQIKMIAELEKATMFFSAGGNLGDYVQLQQSYEVPTGAQETIGRSSVGEPETRSSEDQGNLDFARSLIEPGAQ